MAIFNMSATNSGGGGEPIIIRRNSDSYSSLVIDVKRNGVAIPLLQGESTTIPTGVTEIIVSIGSDN